jgi:hypothetical protein
MCLLSSEEITLEEQMAVGGKQIQASQKIRLLGVSVGNKRIGALCKRSDIRAVIPYPVRSKGPLEPALLQ